MKEKEKKLKVELQTAKRKNNDKYTNLYIFIDGYRFELVPHCRTITETSFFYDLLKRSEVSSAD